MKRPKQLREELNKVIKQINKLHKKQHDLIEILLKSYAYDYEENK